MQNIEDTEVLIIQFYKWWNQDPSVDRNCILSPNIMWDQGLPGMKDEDVVWLVEQKLAWEDFRIVDSIVAGEKAAMVVEGMDPITNLYHRVSWLFEIEDNLIVRILETVSTLDKVGIWA